MSRYWFSWEHATDWAFSLYLHLMSLTRNKQKTPYPKCRVFGTEKGGSGEEKLSALSPHMGHCTGMGSPSQTSAWHQAAHQHRVVEARQEQLCRWKPAPCAKTPTFLHHACFKLSHSFFPLRLDAAGGSKSFLCFFMRPQKNDQDLTRASSMLICSVEMRGGQ